MKNKKVKISITIDSEINKQMEEFNINKSKLINNILVKYFLNEKK